MANLPDGVIPTPDMFINTGRPCLVHYGAGRFLVVLWFDTCDVNVYGNVPEAATSWWQQVQHGGTTLLQRTEAAEAKARDLEQGRVLTISSELRSRVSELPHDGTYDLSKPEDRERLLTALT